MQISEFFEDKKPNHSKAKDKKPKKIKPNMGHESPHPMQGKLVGEDVSTLNTEPKLGKLPHEEVESVIHQWVNQEDHIELSNGMHVLSGENHGYADNVALIVDADYKILDNDDDIVELMQQFTAQEIDPSIVENKDKKLPKQNNPVAKHSRNMSGAGAHKSSKDYDRKKEKVNLKKELGEGEERSIIRDAVVQQLVDTFGESPGLFADNKEDLIAKMYSDLEAMDVEDVVDPRMEVGGQPIGNFASGGVLNVIDSNSAIEDALQHVNLNDMEDYVDEGTYVANKSDVIDSILRQIKDKAQDDDELLRSLAKIISKRADPRMHNRPDARWELEPISEDATPEEIQAEIQRLQPIADKLEYAKSEARDITKQIKYADTHMTVIRELNSLADKLGIEEKELDYYERQVFDANSKLESAIYEMEEVFEEKYKEVAYKIEELEMDLDDMKYEQQK
ncbi:hypothetical protein OAQ62_01540 [bacterium]|nr:hypothetical protein [bacterium]